ncbi:uncharacterized protein TNCV_623741 [Trichonephila clavipes]|nr:uncharacterized protein TNCV_623741 [Trichonephila clavipes]
MNILVTKSFRTSSIARKSRRILDLPYSSIWRNLHRIFYISILANCSHCGSFNLETEWYRYRTVACLVTSSSPVPLKTRRVGQRCTLNLSRAETSSCWCGVVVRRGNASSGAVHVT